jgi:exodeoxyribonuclease III
MKIYSWNVNGLRAIEKKGFVEWVEKTSPDIIGLQEIKAKEDQISEAIKNIPGYKVFFNPAERKGYSGTAVFYKVDPVSITCGLPDEKFNNEGRTICMEYNDFILLNIYFPNGQKDEERLKFKLDFYDCLFDYIENLVSKGKKLLIFGDFNTAHNDIDLKNPKPNSKRSGFLRIERDWLDKLVSAGYVDTYRYLNPEKVEYSWWSYRFNARKNNAGWRIDYHFISENMKDFLLDANIHTDVIGSDHCPVSVDLKF